MLPVRGLVSGIGLHQVRFVGFDANLIDAGHGCARSAMKSSTSFQLRSMRTICTTTWTFAPRSCFMRAKRTKLSRTFSNRAPLR